MHKKLAVPKGQLVTAQKICWHKGANTQPSTFTLLPTKTYLPDVPFYAIDCLDGYSISRVSIVFSDHLGINGLISYTTVKWQHS